MSDLPQRIVSALLSAQESLTRGSDRIATVYEQAERSGDYSEADETAADVREHLHDEFGALLDVFADAYPELFHPKGK